MFKQIKETKAELRHVSWPTQKQAVGYTVATIIVSFAVAAYLGAFDYIFAQILRITL
jgi:preprotein translocase subunit SecE